MAQGLPGRGRWYGGAEAACVKACAAEACGGALACGRLLVGGPRAIAGIVGAGPIACMGGALALDELAAMACAFTLISSMRAARVCLVAASCSLISSLLAATIADVNSVSS